MYDRSGTLIQNLDVGDSSGLPEVPDVYGIMFADALVGPGASEIRNNTFKWTGPSGHYSIPINMSL